MTDYTQAIRAVVPKNLTRFISDDFLEEIDRVETNPEVADRIKENALSYANVLEGQNNIQIGKYIQAVIYASYKLVGHTTLQCYAKTFPDRYANLVSRGVPKEDIVKYGQGIERTKLFSKIMEQAIIPSWILNQDLFQKALNVQASLMMTASSEKVRCDAANSILTHLARPKEVPNIVINNNTSGSDALASLNAAMHDLAMNQQTRIINGEATQHIAKEAIVHDNTDDQENN